MVFIHSCNISTLLLLMPLQYLLDIFSQYIIASFPIFAFQSPCMNRISRKSIFKIVFVAYCKHLSIYLYELSFVGAYTCIIDKLSDVACKWKLVILSLITLKNIIIFALSLFIRKPTPFACLTSLSM